MKIIQVCFFGQCKNGFQGVNMIKHIYMRIQTPRMLPGLYCSTRAGFVELFNQGLLRVIGPSVVRSGTAFLILQGFRFPKVCNPRLQ